MDTVRVLMSTYNGEKYLQKQIDTIRNQKFVKVSCLVRDDNSKDTTVDILKMNQCKNKNFDFYFGENKGAPLSFYDLVKHSGEFEYYAFSDQDDLWDLDKLRIAIDKLKALNSEKPCMYCSNYRLIDCNDVYLHDGKNKEKLMRLKYSPLLQNLATGCTVVFNNKAKQLFLRSEPKDMIMHDYWLYVICSFLGEVYYDVQPHISYRQHENNVLGSKDTFLGKWKSRMHSFSQLNKQPREKMIKEFLFIYNDLLNKEQVQKINKFVLYRKSMNTKLNLLLDKDIRMDSFDRNFWLSIRIFFESI